MTSWRSLENHVWLPSQDEAKWQASLQAGWDTLAQGGPEVREAEGRRNVENARVGMVVVVEGGGGTRVASKVGAWGVLEPALEEEGEASQPQDTLLRVAGRELARDARGGAADAAG